MRRTGARGGRGGSTGRPPGGRFVVQEHHASRLHYDFRLELAGTLKSWALPKGPTLDPTARRLAVMVEDHPVSYIDFEGTIAEGRYGAGEVRVWDSGRYRLVDDADPLERLERGRLGFVLEGRRLRGRFSLVRMEGRGEGNWLLLKARDEHAVPGWRLAPVLPAAPPDREPARRRGPARPRTVRSSGTARRRRATSAPEPVPAEAVFGAGRLEGDRVVDVGGTYVSLTNLDKVYWPDDGYTKGDLLAYYWRVRSAILPYLAGRPLILRRYPDGIAGGQFHQHDLDAPPPFVRTVPIETEAGRTIDYAVCDDLPTLLYLVNLGTIEPHPWHSRAERLERPDWMVLDLDPAGAEFRAVLELALVLRDLLGREGLVAFPKTSGASGMHLYVPLAADADYATAASLAERLARRAAAERPELVTLERGRRSRKQGLIYLDYLQNARGKSVVAPYSARARPGATVSTPLAWAEVERGVDPVAFTIRTVPRRLAERDDPFRPLLTTRGRR
ncbi:MAG TPA: non-homologous end-joining DNA ligase [Gemmatimonadales bacterium]|nr:non-homologous end-joining DNA ligase [Gemmatimonadales bacterium]